MTFWCVRATNVPGRDVSGCWVPERTKNNNGIQRMYQLSAADCDLAWQYIHVEPHQLLTLIRSRPPFFLTSVTVTFLLCY